MWYCEKPARHNQTLGFNLKGFFQQPPPPLHQTGMDTRRSQKKKKKESKPGPWCDLELPQGWSSGAVQGHAGDQDLASATSFCTRH